MTRPHLIFASDSFKGNLSSAKTAELLAQAASEVLPGATYTAVPMADGGEGTADALIAALGGRQVKLRIHAPSESAVREEDLLGVSLGLLADGSAIVESARAIGIDPEASFGSLKCSASFGVGEMIRAALGRRCPRIFITLGGTGTNDGGMGMMQQLGVRFLDERGKELVGSTRNLGRVRRIDLSHMDPRIARTEFVAMCDVDNPLTGPNGATYTFGPQKAGLGTGYDLSRDERLQRGFDEIEAGMRNYERVLAETFGYDVGHAAGAGAAGGLGAACLAFLGAELKPGIETVLELVHFDDLLKGADIVITGEGKLDAQTAHGKVVAGIAAACKQAGVPCVAIAGSVAPGAEDIPGLTAAMPIALGPCTLGECLEHSEDLYLRAARRVLAIFGAGRKD